MSAPTDGVLQLVIGGSRGETADRWASDLLARARGLRGFRDGRILVSADGQRVAIGLRWCDLDAMSDAAMVLTELRRDPDAADVSTEPLVFVLDDGGVREHARGVAKPA